AAVEADEGLALAHGGGALVAVVQGDATTARAAAETARRTVAGATRRERQHVEALYSLVGGDTARGLDLVDEHVAEFPRDALLVNQTSSAIGLGGRSDREQFRGLPRASGSRVRRRLVVPFGAGLRLPRGGPSRRVAAAVGALAPAVSGQRQRLPQHRPRLLRDRRDRRRPRVPPRLDGRVRPAGLVPLSPRLARGDVRAPPGPPRSSARGLPARYPARGQSTARHDRRLSVAVAA